MLIKPFKALRPNKTDVERIASPSYQSLSEEEVENHIENNPYSFFHVTKPAKNSDGTDLYTLAKENLAAFIENGWLMKSEKPAYYVYRLSYMDELIYGLVASVPKDEIESDKLSNRLDTNHHAKLIDASDALLYPVTLTYPNHPALEKDLQEIRMKKLPIYLFDTPDDYNHCVWMIDDPKDIETITKYFAEDVAHFTVHNRSEVVAAVSDYILAIAFPEPLIQEPKILDGLFVLQRETKVE